MTVLTTYDPDEFKDLIRESVKIAVELELSKLRSNRSEQKQFLSRQETAELLGISVVTLDSYVRAGFIPAFRLGYKIRFKYSDVVQALNRINVGGQ